MNGLEYLWSDIIRDIDLILTYLTVDDAYRPIGFILWFICFCMPLTKIDRRDYICGLTYAIVLTTLGMILVFVLPDIFLDSHSLRLEGLSATFFFVISCVRWVWGMSAVQEIKATTPVADLKTKSLKGMRYAGSKENA